MGQQVGRESITALSCFLSRLPPLTDDGAGTPILNSADGALQACRRPRWRECSAHEPPHCPHVLGTTV